MIITRSNSRTDGDSPRSVQREQHAQPVKKTTNKRVVGRPRKNTGPSKNTYLEQEAIPQTSAMAESENNVIQAVAQAITQVMTQQMLPKLLVQQPPQQASQQVPQQALQQVTQLQIQNNIGKPSVYGTNSLKGGAGKHEKNNCKDGREAENSRKFTSKVHDAPFDGPKFSSAHKSTPDTPTRDFKLTPGTFKLIATTGLNNKGRAPKISISVEIAYNKGGRGRNRQ